MDAFVQPEDQDTSASSEQEAARQEGAQVVPMVLITLPQRAALIEYLAKQPYADVANGIEFLKTAPQINVTITPPSESVDGDSNQL